MAASWDHRRYGTITDPVRQSDLHELASNYACSRRFWFRKNEEAAGKAVERPFAHWKPTIGSATHETIRRYLTNATAKARVLAGTMPSREAVLAMLSEEMLKAAGGKAIDWQRAKQDEELEDAVHMVLAALEVTARVACEIVVCEGPFLAPIDCPGAKASYWLQGTIDLAYRPKANPAGLGLLDWKTGAERPERIILDHGYQLGIYGHALEAGTFYPGLEKAFGVGQFPDELAIAHLRDAVPYSRAGTKEIKREEDAAFYGVAIGEKVKYSAGDPRGPVLYPARRDKASLGRLRDSIHTLVGTVRLGRFVEYLGDGCLRCAFATRCLTRGHEVMGEERDLLEDALAGLDKKHLQALTDLDTDAA